MIIIVITIIIIIITIIKKKEAGAHLILLRSVCFEKRLGKPFCPEL